MAPDRPIRPPLLSGLSTRSAGPGCELLLCAALSAIRSLAARLSLLRSRIPLALCSLRNEPDQLPLEPEALERSGWLDEVLAASEVSVTAGAPVGIGTGGSSCRGEGPLIPGGIGDCGNSLYPAGVGGTGPSCVPR
jgi:hypothetical protein